jgi:hypothetical protein
MDGDGLLGDEAAVNQGIRKVALTLNTEKEGDMAEPRDSLDEVLTKLSEVAKGLRDSETDRDALVLSARRDGASWERIGEALGIAKQTAWERYRRLEESA